MFKGIPSKGLEFYNLLMKSDEFTSELGKVALASGRLEAELILYLQNNGVKENINKAPLGKLVSIGEKKSLFDENLTLALNRILKERNYLVHNIYSLFTDLIDETFLQRDNLLDTDILTYQDITWQLKDNLTNLADIIQIKNKSKS